MMLSVSVSLISIYQVPTVEISRQGIQEAGQKYTLICSVTGIGDHSSIIYLWTKNNGTRQQIGTTSNFLTFSPLRLSDAGQYICQVTGLAETYGAIEYIDIQSEFNCLMK